MDFLLAGRALSIYDRCQSIPFLCAQVNGAVTSSGMKIASVLLQVFKVDYSTSF